MKTTHRRASRITAWGIAITAVAVLGAPHASAIDGDGWYPAPPIPVRVSGNVSNFWAGSVTASSWTSVGGSWLQSAQLRYQWQTLPEHGPEGEVMDVVVKAAVANAGYVSHAHLGTPTHATGASADLALALALIDAQTPGSLTQGRDIAVTGQLVPSGGVLPVEGAEAKADGAEKQGFKVMLIPEGNSADVVAHDSLRIYPVKSLRQAIRVLCRLGASDGACSKK